MAELDSAASAVAIDAARVSQAAATPAASTGNVTANKPPVDKPTGVQAFDKNGKPDASNSTDSDTTVTSDTAALKQKNVLHENGAAGDNALSNAAAAFNNVTAAAGSLLQAAAALKAKPAPPRTAPPRNKTDNYYLTETEKELLYRKAREFAAPGIVPYDVLEQFLFILVTIKTYEDLSYIAKVVGIPDLDDPTLVREPMRILQVKDLNKIGYLANAVAAINKQFSETFASARSLDDVVTNPYGSVMDVSKYVTSPIGATAACSGGGEYTAALLGLGAAAASAIDSKMTIDRFPLSDVVTDMVGDLLSSSGVISQVTSLLGTISGFGGIVGQIAQLSGVASLLSSFITNTDTTANFMEKTGIATHFPIANQLKEVIAKADKLSDFISMLSNVSTVANSPRQGDIMKQLQKIATMKAEIATLVSTIQSACQAVQGPGNIGAACASLTKIGGFATSGILSELTMGQRLPASAIAKNPMLQQPSFIGKNLFGESPTPRIAVEENFAKRIACFPSEKAGAGASSFGMQNFASFGGVMTVAQMVSKTITGSTTPPTSGTTAAVVAQKTTDVANLLNVSEDQDIEARRSDNAIPYMVAASAVLANQDTSPFSTDTFAEGWKMASAAGNDVQRYNPELLNAVQTSL